MSSERSKKSVLIEPILEYRKRRGYINENSKYPFSDEFDSFYSMPLSKLKKLSKLYESKLKNIE